MRLVQGNVNISAFYIQHFISVELRIMVVGDWLNHESMKILGSQDVAAQTPKIDAHIKQSELSYFSVEVKTLITITTSLHPEGTVVRKIIVYRPKIICQIF